MFRTIFRQIDQWPLDRLDRHVLSSPQADSNSILVYQMGFIIKLAGGKLFSVFNIPADCRRHIIYTRRATQ